MRITTGKYKGRVLRMPLRIRPTQDKVRKAIFDILGDVEGLTFLELFAGSGAVGFEALSRGVRELVLAESDRECQLAIKRNIELLRPRNCLLYPHAAEKVIPFLKKEKRVFDLVFLDPPYYKSKHAESLTKKTLQILNSYDILAPCGFIIAQHSKKDELPKESGELVLVKEARYGDTALSFYRKQCAK
ncbi:MAG: 16S rRNA (guanine(966)-N(2))-methyltransferase RsmD [Candidatus Omnitrophica bacterium]|nr:16S rRNA (guanine(966)-N(2))-methyltransferase RsmD [Candidatus Omnitrophota bacterium]MBU1869433.1 16S rRNA (guanine(966)-N(2))-methyltransferase RsmD [Candidatus Omnitrophota bacterium]